MHDVNFVINKMLSKEDGVIEVENLYGAKRIMTEIPGRLLP